MKRWICFWGFILLDVFIFVNSLTYFLWNQGVFRTTNICDFLYTYQANGKLTFEQFDNLNNYALSNLGQPIYISQIDGGIVLKNGWQIRADFALPNPQEYNLVLVDTNTMNSDSARGIGLVFGAASCIFPGALIICLLYFWANKKKRVVQNA